MFDEVEGVMFEVNLVGPFVAADDFGLFVCALIGADLGLDHSRTIWHPGGARLVVRREASSLDEATAAAVAALRALGVETRPRG